MATDTAALQKYIESMKALANDNVRAAEKQNLINSALKDSSQVARDVAQNKDGYQRGESVWNKKTPQLLSQSVRHYLNSRLKVSV